MSSQKIVNTGQDTTYADLRRETEHDQWDAAVFVAGGRLQMRCWQCVDSAGIVVENNPLVAPEWDRGMSCACEVCGTAVPIIKASYWPVMTAD